jgi:Protein of unknown function (Hypoth_ymh)
MYNLTESQKDYLKCLVLLVKAETLSEEFEIDWAEDIWGREPEIVDLDVNKLKPNKLVIEALIKEELLNSADDFTKFSLTRKAYEAVDSDFDAPDTSFIKHLTPLADISGFDKELKERCLPILGAGNDPKHWDSAIIQAFRVLEERLRSVSGVPASDKNTSENLVNKVFGDASKLITDNKERTSYRNLYSGIFTVFRNEYGHRFVDPSPEDGGTIITFVNLLLKMLEDLRTPSSSGS